MTNKPSYLIAALLMMPVLASACDAVCQRMQRQQQRDMNYQMHLQETQRIQGQYNRGYSTPSYYTRYGVVVDGFDSRNDSSKIFRADGYSSNDIAANVAMTGCQSAGLQCRILFDYHNGCLALSAGQMSSGVPKVFPGFHGQSKWRAKSQALQTCTNAGAKNCYIHGEIKCSLPSRTPY